MYLAGTARSELITGEIAEQIDDEADVDDGTRDGVDGDMGGEMSCKDQLICGFHNTNQDNPKITETSREAKWNEMSSVCSEEVMDNGMVKLQIGPEESGLPSTTVTCKGEGLGMEGME